MTKRIVAPLAALLTLIVPTLALAEAPAGGSDWSVNIAMALAIGLAALGGGLGQGRAGAAALEGIARNPGSSDKVFVPMLLALSFVESLVIFALVIAFMIKG